MPTFLSPEWLDSMAEAAAAEAVRQATRDVVLTIQHVVTGGPAGEVRYWVRVDRGQVGVGPGEAPGAPADVTFREDYATAAALARGELTPQEAVMAGVVRAGGDVGRLVEHRAALGGLADAFAAVRAATVYP